MRILSLLILAFSVTGCSSMRCRIPFLRGGQTLDVASCERKGNELHVTVQQPCEPQAACSTGTVCSPGPACSTRPGTCKTTVVTQGCRKALTLGWIRIPVPFPKVQRIPVCQQVVVPGCAQAVPGQMPVLPQQQVPVIPHPSNEQPVPVPQSAGRVSGAPDSGLVNRAAQLEDQVRRLRNVLNQREAVLSQGTGQSPAENEVPILAPPQRWGPDDGVPAFTQSPIEQLSGSAQTRTSPVESWPYSPQNPHRRAPQ